ncbi:MAG: DUF6033 family protein [Lachnospiraceae bacterium]|nr:DUF6033 family protein [Lachnospiraceae bacterium]
MGMLNDAIGSYQRAAGLGATSQYGKTVRPKTAKAADKAEKTEALETKESTGKITGKTIGDPKLSDNAAKLYDQLKEKYGDMEFILVSDSQKNAVEKNAAAYGQANKTVVLISEGKLEKMAGDDNYRKQVEGTIDKAKDQIEQAKAQLASSPLGASVKTIGINVNEKGETSFFATIDKSLSDSNKLAKERAENKKEEKAAEKKQAKKLEDKERLEKMKDKKAEGKDAPEKEEDIERFEADSVEALLRKLEDFTYSRMSDSVITKEEAALGGSIDFKG